MEEVKEEVKKEGKRVGGKAGKKSFLWKKEEGRSFLSGCFLGEGRRMKDKKVRPKAHFNIPRKVSGNSVGVLAAEVKTRKNANCDLLRKGWA